MLLRALPRRHPDFVDGDPPFAGVYACTESQTLQTKRLSALSSSSELLGGAFIQPEPSCMGSGYIDARIKLQKPKDFFAFGLWGLAEIVEG